MFLIYWEGVELIRKPGDLLLFHEAILIVIDDNFMLGIKPVVLKFVYMKTIAKLYVLSIESPDRLFNLYLHTPYDFSSGFIFFWM